MIEGKLIKTKYLGPTNHRGSRVKASYSGYEWSVSKTLDWNHELDSTANHLAAARAVATQMDAENQYYTVDVVARAWDDGPCKYFVAQHTPRNG